LTLARAKPGGPGLLAFLRQWARNPLRVGAIAPSGVSLARLMAREVVPGAGRVIEFGGGTGAITQALLARGIPADQFEVVEINPRFAAGLRQRFPTVAVIEGSAAALGGRVAGDYGSYRFVVSGLPLIAMPKPLAEAIVAEAFRLLAPDGIMLQFTYVPRCPVPPAVLRRHGLTCEKVGFALDNIPPAHVFRLRREGPAITQGGME